MATKLQKAVRFTLMWMLVPAALAAVGYYVLGPMMGSSTPAEPEQKEETQGDYEPTSKSARNFKPPAVEVSVRKGQTLRERDLVIRRSRPKPKPKPEEAPTQEAPKPPVVSPPSDGGDTVPVGDGLSLP